MKKWYSKKLLGFAAGTIVLVMLVGLILFRQRPAVGELVNKLPAI